MLKICLRFLPNIDYKVNTDPKLACVPLTGNATTHVHSYDMLDSSEKLALYNSHIKNTQRYNLRRKQVDFKIGDIVWKRCYFQSDKDAHFAKKLAPKFQKCRIVAKRSPLVFTLQDMSGKDLGNWHVKDFKLAPSSSKERSPSFPNLKYDTPWQFLRVDDFLLMIDLQLAFLFTLTGFGLFLQRWKRGRAVQNHLIAFVVFDAIHNVLYRDDEPNTLPAPLQS
ncbi:hypothetical protein HW555_011301 [Spodoptera exigua]|uniref:Uncharacterized protein n=1 Tax=Spodoptera exigua TaxID=7107 RepID=A0A835G5M0_SPOEX|nr:hypothetical protein HW555_011301 [Spodoptera exigua]